MTLEAGNQLLHYRVIEKGAQVGGSAQPQGVRPDGQAVELPEIRIIRGGERVCFLPDGSGLIYLTDPTGHAQTGQDFWLLDLASMESRQLTQLATADSERIRTFDITPDGRTIVFDRLGDN